MKVGDIVKIKPTTELKDRKEKICFIEDLLGRRYTNGKQQEQVSLYGMDGEYVGDWFEDEFDELNKKITEKELKELIEKNKDYKGLIKHFEKVLKVIQGNG